jgi:hypothetical protein
LLGSREDAPNRNYPWHWDHFPTIDEVVAKTVYDAQWQQLRTSPFTPQMCHFDLDPDIIAAQTENPQHRRSSPHGFNISWLHDQWMTEQPRYYPAIKAAYVCSTHGVHPEKVLIQGHAWSIRHEAWKAQHFKRSDVDIIDFRDQLSEQIQNFIAEAERTGRLTRWAYWRTFQHYDRLRIIETSHESW